MSEKPTYATSSEVKHRIDLYLYQMAKIECKLGTDSTEKERLNAKELQKTLLLRIKAIDEEFYNSINP